MKLTVLPYKTPRKVWAFNHEHRETKGELLLNGTEDVIDCYYKQLTGKDPEPGDQMKFTLDTEPFPEASTVLHRVSGDEEGTVYIDQMTKMRVWLCPWLQGFFGHVPDTLYILPELITNDFS